MTKSDRDSSSGSESSDSRGKQKNKDRKEKRKEKREDWKKNKDEKREEGKKAREERKDDKKKHKDHKAGHSDPSASHAAGLGVASTHQHLMTQGEQPHFGGGSVGGYHYPEHTQKYGQHGGGEHGGFHQQSTPPPYVAQNPLPPPSGYRIPLTTQAVFPLDSNQTGPPAFIDADGISHIFIGSALMESSVHPCKIGPHLNPFASVPYGGVEHGHQGRFDLLPFREDQMQWVHTSTGRIPFGRIPVEGGYEDDGSKLYHAVAVVNGVKVPGKTGEHLGGARIPFGGIEHEVYEYEILCWR